MENKRLEQLIQPSLLSFLFPVAVISLLWFVGSVFLPESLWSVSFSGSIDQIISENYSFASEFTTLIAWAIYLFVGIMLVQLNDRFMLISRRTMLPLVFFLLLTSTNVNLYIFSLSQISLSFILLAFFLLLSTYRRQDMTVTYFLMGMALSIAVLLTSEFVFLLPLYVIAMFQLNAFSFRSLLAFLTGLVVLPYIIVTLIYCFASPGTLSVYLSQYFSSVSFSVPNYDWNFVKVIFYSSVFAVTIFALLLAMRRANYDNEKSRCFYAVVRNFFLVSVLFLFFLGDKLTHVYPLAVLFASIILAHYFSTNFTILKRSLFLLVVITSFLYFLHALLF